VSRLVVDAGPHASLAVQLVGETLIGRDPGACQVVLDRDPGVSRRHARVAPGPNGTWVYRDLGSANGSWLASGGGRQRLADDYALLDGDRIELGATALVFKAELAVVSNTVLMAGRDSSATVVHAKAGWPAQIAYLVERGGGARTVRLGPETTLGRAQDCELVIEAPDVSRRHASVRHEGERFVLYDLGSANGTFLMRDDRLRRLDAPVELQHGDAVVLGRFQFGFMDTSAEARAADAPAASGPRVQLEELTIEIDQNKAARDAAQVMESDYFRALRARAQQLRRRDQPAGSSRGEG
jgi:pSer/pThr/pTyr-binding forkhead associated (FHA) protein